MIPEKKIDRTLYLSQLTTGVTLICLSPNLRSLFNSFFPPLLTYPLFSFYLLFPFQVKPILQD